MQTSHSLPGSTPDRESVGDSSDESCTKTGPPATSSNGVFEQHLREMNEVLLLSSIRQHELAEKAQESNLWR